MFKLVFVQLVDYGVCRFRFVLFLRFICVTTDVPSFSSETRSIDEFATVTIAWVAVIADISTLLGWADYSLMGC